MTRDLLDGSFLNVRRFFLFLVSALVVGGALFVLLGGDTLRDAEEFDPGFDLDRCVGSAQLIVRGSIDGADRLSIEQVFAGDPGGVKVVVLGNTDRYYNRARQGPMRERARAYLEWFWRRYLPWLERKEAVVFLQRQELDRKWTTSDSTAWLRGAGVYPNERFGVYGLAPSYQRGPFFAALADAIRTAAERTRLLAQPRSPERARALVALALAHDRLPPTTDDKYLFIPFYHLTEIGRGLRNPSPAEEAIVLSALESAQTDGDRVKLLRLAGLIPLPPDEFAAVAKFTSRATSASVRAAALDAIGMIDLWQAQGVLVPFFSLEEPQLQRVLEDIDPKNRWLVDPGLPQLARNRAIVEPLVRLGRELHAEDERRVKAGAPRSEVQYEGRLSTLIWQFERSPHPQFICLLMEWILTPRDVRAVATRQTLFNVVDPRLPMDDLTAWAAWWRKAQPLLEKTYDLQTEAGRAAWLAAWTQADERTRPFLTDLWNYETQIDEGALLALAEQPAAARLLSELWRQQRLTTETQQALVKRFLKISLVEQPPWNPPEKWAAHREVVIQSETSFPFPAVQEVEHRHRIEIAAEPKQPTKADLLPGYGACGLGAENPQTWGAVGEGYPGKPKARGILEMREVDYAYDRRVLWELVWELGPLQLRDSGP